LIKALAPRTSLAAADRERPREIGHRPWAYGQGLSEAEIEVLVRARLNLLSTPMSSSRLRVGSRDFHVVKTIDPEWRLVLINDLSKRRAEE
jgi:hypothetical protein